MTDNVGHEGRAETADYFVCVPAQLIDRSNWTTHHHRFNPKIQGDQDRALRETAECIQAQHERLAEALRHHDPTCGGVRYWPEPSQEPCHCRCKVPIQELLEGRKAKP